MKIRGFRVELPEIESLLRELPGVAGAAVAVHEGDAGIQQIVGYLVPRNGKLVSDDEIRGLLRAKLPTYMVPQLFEWLRELPVLPSGKVDRKKLPAPTQKKVTNPTAVAAETGFESKIAKTWEKVFRQSPISIDDDFFMDLGGHSLLAATMVSDLRNDPAFADLSMIDVYNYPTVRKLAVEFEARRNTRTTEVRKQTDASPEGSSSFHLAGLAQALGLYFVMGFFSIEWIGPYLAYAWMIEHGHSIIASIAAALAVILGIGPIMLLASIGVKWLVLGRIKPGRYPLWGSYYLRWWFVNRILSAVQVDGLEGTPLYNIYLRMMGARIGRNVYIGSEAVGTWDLLSVGDDTSVGMGARLLGYTVENGMLKIGPITVGKRCFVGAESALRPFATMEDDSRLGNLSMLSEGATIPSGEEWVGSPARPLPRKDAPSDAAQPEPTARSKRTLFGALYGLGVFLLPLVYLAALFPGIILMNYISLVLPGLWFIAASPVVATIFVLFVCLEIALIKRLLLGKVKSGTYALSSWFHVRKWFVDQLMDISLEVIGPLYASLYLPPWYRLLGAKMGKNAEISTAGASTPDLLDIGDEGFIADSVFLGAPHIDKGQVTIGVTRLGKRAFIGNSALIPSGSVIGDGSLIGVLSTPPLGVPGASAPSTSWVGSPAIFLPQRQTSKSFSEETTYRPTRKLYLQRLFIEFIRIILPATFFTLLASLMIYGVIRFHQEYSTVKLILVFPLLYTGCALAAALVVIAFKWLLMGRYKPNEKPLWSTFVWKNELVTALYEHLAGPFMFDLVEGTPFFGWLLRLLGTKVGRRVYFETTEFTEFDLVKIGDDVTLNVDCTIQTHLFEDRVMKMSTVEIGDGCSIGTGSVVLYDTKMHDGASLSDLSLLMKGETLPAATRWEGTPARRASGVSLPSMEPVPQTGALVSPSTLKENEPVQDAYRPDDGLLDAAEIGILAAQHE